MSTSQTQLVALAVNGDVFLVVALEILDRGMCFCRICQQSSRPSGSLTEDQCAGTVPIARDRLGLNRDLGAKLLGNTVEKEAGNPQVVTHLNAPKDVASYMGYTALYALRRSTLEA